jgi:D-sedoheptulose 7-phosphate isomerase
MNALCNISVFEDYIKRLNLAINMIPLPLISKLSDALIDCHNHGRQIFICGNGGSAGNAIHLANDLMYGVAKKTGCGIKAIALPSNQSIITCLANDVGYANIFSEQLALYANSDDLLLVLSGSGNSSNIINALIMSKSKKMKSFAILGYSGGACMEYADEALHIPVNDMQISEDIQLIIGHMIMQRLSFKFQGTYEVDQPI